MSRVKFFALGGLGEVGKNMYVVEVDGKIFVLDVGSSSPTSQVLGYDQIIADYKYLVQNVAKVKGVFISRFHEHSSGAFARIASDLKVPYYGSKFTVEALKRRSLDKLSNEEMQEIKLNIVEENQTIDFDGTEVTFFRLTNNVPGTLGIAIKVNISEDENNPIMKNIVYYPDSNFDQNLDKNFKTNYKALAKLAEDGILVFLSSSTGANRMGFVSSDEKLQLSLHKIMSHEGRTYVVMFSDNVAGILKVIDVAFYQKRQVTIIGYKARILVELANKLGYTNIIDNKLYMYKQDLNDEKRNSDNTVIIIAGEQAEPLFALQKIALREDKHYFLKPQDNVVILPEIPKKFEKILAETWNLIWGYNCNFIDFDTKLMPASEAGSEDLKMMYSMLDPDYIIPVSGDYRMLKAQEKIALRSGYKKDKVIDLDNGIVAIFENGKLVEYGDVEINETLFSTEADADINDYVANERASLTQEGFIVVSGMINLKEREIYKEIEIASYGFLPKFGQEEMYETIKSKFRSIVETHLRLKKIDYKLLRADLKNTLSKMILKETKKRPLLLPVIIDISM